LALATLFLSSAGNCEKAILGKKNILDRSLVSYKDLNYLSLFLKKKYNIETVINFNNSSRFNIGCLYIKNTTTISKVIKPHILYSQYNLLNKPIKLNFIGACPIHISQTKRDFSTIKDLSDIKYTKQYKNEYVLSLEQEEAIIGIILGDGYLDRAKPTHNTRLRIEQSYPEKEQYVISLHKLLEPLVTMSPSISTRKDKRKGIVTKSMHFRTLAMPCLNYYHDLFYNNKVKSVPKGPPLLRRGGPLDQLLTARGLKVIRSFSTSTAYCARDSIKPVKIYSNAANDKTLIYKDNKNKCGIYC
jgi:hypothetical protein